MYYSGLGNLKLAKPCKVMAAPHFLLAPQKSFKGPTVRTRVITGVQKETKQTKTVRAHQQSVSTEPGQIGPFTAGTSLTLVLCRENYQFTTMT